MRQGGINLPWFFNLYINDLTVKLRNSGYGCYIFVDFFGYLFFADDILLLSGSIIHLKFMINICTEYGLNFDIKFNQSKSFLFQIGLDINEVLHDLHLCGIALKWVKCLKYLGI